MNRSPKRVTRPVDVFANVFTKQRSLKFKARLELCSAIRQQNWNSVDDRITAAASLTVYCFVLQLYGLVAHGAHDPTQILRHRSMRSHASILAKLAQPWTAVRRDTIKKMTTIPRILDGTAIAAQIKTEVAAEVQALKAEGITPGLAVVLVGEVAASQIYVRSKVKTCGELGIFSELITPPENITTDEMLDLIDGLNERDDIDGILVQLPLPRHVDTKRLLEAVVPDKDVDGFHPVNAGRLQSGQPALAPCTPAGIMEILRRSNLPIAGQNAVVIGRSDIVGKPAAMMLLNASATVTVCHSKTRDLARFTREADILVAAIGRTGYVTPEMVKPGATLIDVGINRITDPEEVEKFFPNDAARAATFAKRGSVVVGDIHPAAFAHSGAYTPVPGGVGALTIAMLMQNTVQAARLRRGLTTEKK
jgi:methylenetetrahydrofolate dehydrogenase (NADP+) / methenyltetrahydrofolate cyclohydrolase